MDRIRDKRSFRMSSITNWRERTPTSPALANRGNVNMVQDYSRQQKVMPNTLGGRAVFNESLAVSEGNTRRLRTMNASGKPMALDVMVGGFPDARASNKGPVIQNQMKLIPTKGR